MPTRDLTCICCPLGCALQVEQNESGTVIVKGNTCNRGAKYGENEVLHPMRTVTSTVRVAGQNKMVPVKTENEIPKDKIFSCMAALKEIEVTTPIQLGDIVCKNVADTGVNIVATKTVQ